MGKIGADNPNWRGGRFVDDKGYVKVRVDGRYRREHRVIAERLIGRVLTEIEVVHHVDENTVNNDPANLEVYCCNGHHRSRHASGDLSGRLWPPAPPEYLANKRPCFALDGAA